MRVLIDVDGPVADLMDGLEKFIRERTGHELKPNTSLTHRISRSPVHAELNELIDLDRCLHDFLSLPDVYQEYVLPVPDSVESIHRLKFSGYELGFVTATLWTAPSSYSSKMRWLDKHFPGIPMLAVSSSEKHWVTGDYAIDDRYDTCFRWGLEGVKPFLFRRSWNEAPPGVKSYDWKEIMDEFATL